MRWRRAFAAFAVMLAAGCSGAPAIVSPVATIGQATVDAAACDQDAILERLDRIDAKLDALSGEDRPGTLGSLPPASLSDLASGLDTIEREVNRIGTSFADPPSSGVECSNLSSLEWSIGRVQDKVDDVQSTVENVDSTVDDICYSVCR